MLHTIEIEKNFFSDKLHPFPAYIETKSLDEARELASSYERSLKEFAQGDFSVYKEEGEHGIYFTLTPLRAPTNYFIHRLSFSITDENDLKSFWDYFFEQSRSRCYIEPFKRLMSMVYAVVSYGLPKASSAIFVYIQETEHAFVVTIKDMAEYSYDAIKDIVQKKDHQIKYLIGNRQYTFFASKVSKSEGEKKSTGTSVEVENEILPQSSADSRARVSFKDDSSASVHLFDFLDHYEIDELIELMNEFNSMILILGQSSFTQNEALMMIHYIKSMAKILIRSHESFSIGMHIDQMADGLLEYLESFLERSKDLGDLCGAFNQDMTQWLKKLFFEGAPSLHFMDESIISNCQTILTLIDPRAQESATEDVDDIFDF